jgi:hypothetical protein
MNKSQRVTPFWHNDTRSRVTVTFGARRTKALIEEVKRFSASKLQEAALQAMQLPIYRKLLDHVLAKNNIKLADETTGAMVTEPSAAEQITPAIPPPVGDSEPLPVAA